MNKVLDFDYTCVSIYLICVEFFTWLGLVIVVLAEAQLQIMFSSERILLNNIASYQMYHWVILFTCAARECQ